MSSREALECMRKAVLALSGGGVSLSHLRSLLNECAPETAAGDIAWFDAAVAMDKALGLERKAFHWLSKGSALRVIDLAVSIDAERNRRREAAATPPLTPEDLEKIPF